MHSNDSLLSSTKQIDRQYGTSDEKIRWHFGYLPVDGRVQLNRDGRFRQF